MCDQKDVGLSHSGGKKPQNGHTVEKKSNSGSKGHNDSEHPKILWGHKLLNLIGKHKSP